jgi:plasmid stabilization system protein ParE
MDFTIIWSDPALADFEAVVRYVMERNPSAAESLRLAILDHVESLARLPFIGPVYDRDRTGRVREIMCGVYRIFYRVDEDRKTVDILTIWHGARAEPTLPP